MMRQEKEQPLLQTAAVLTIKTQTQEVSELHVVPHLPLLLKSPALFLVSLSCWPEFSTCQTSSPFCYTRGLYQALTFNFCNFEVIFRHYPLFCIIQKYMYNINREMQMDFPPSPFQLLKQSRAL